MIPIVTVKWAVEQPYVGGSLIGTFPTREEAQAVADSQELPHTVHKWEIHEYVNSTGCGWCDQEKVKGYRAPLGSALCAEHNSIRMETL